jgi:hypothetical protein
MKNNDAATTTGAGVSSNGKGLTMAGKMKKGTPVVQINFWNGGLTGDTFTISTRKMVLKSMGAKQGTATVVSSGEMALHRFYAEQIGKTIFAESELSEARIMEIAKAMQDATIKAETDTLNWRVENWGEAEGRYYEKFVNNAKKPLRVASYETLCAEVKTEVQGMK